MSPVTRSDCDAMAARLSRNLSTRTGENTRVSFAHAAPGIWRVGAWTDGQGEREIAVGTSKGEVYSMMDAACKALEYVDERARGNERPRYFLKDDPPRGCEQCGGQPHEFPGAECSCECHTP